MTDSNQFIEQVNTAFLMLLPILSIITYIMMGKAFSKIATKEGHEKSWLAWIPGVNIYLMIQLAGAKMWLILLVIAGIGAAPFIGGLAGILLSAIPGLIIFYLYVKIFERYEVSPIWFIITMLPYGLFYSYLPYFILGMIFNIFGFWKLNKAANNGPIKHRIQTKAFVKKAEPKTANNKKKKKK